MTWGVLDLPEGDSALRLARSLDLPLLATPGDASHLIHLGDDASLARLADLVGPRVAILHQPHGPSDLARMFGAGKVTDRLAHGAPYSIELIEARSEAGRHIAVGHTVASATGRLPRALAATRTVEICRDGREETAQGAGIVVANCQHVDGYTVAPRAALMDGRLDMQVVGGGRLERARSRRAMRRGLHLTSRSVQRRAVRSVAFDLPKGWSMRFDSQRVAGAEWELSVLPGAATLWV